MTDAITDPEARCAYIYAQGAPCPFPREKHTGSLADIWIENLLLVSEITPTHPFHPSHSTGEVDRNP